MQIKRAINHRLLFTFACHSLNSYEKKNENDEDEYETVTEVEVINSLTPIWRRDKKKVSDEDYDTFYSDKFNDYEKPLRHIHVKAEGTFEYNALLYIP